MDITCGRCTKDAGSPQKHETVEDVRNCYREEDSFFLQNQEADALAEQLAELRNEQYWENRGADDGFDEWEARRGVLTYEQARDLAAGA